MEEIRILIISDTHVGSDGGLALPEYETRSGRKVLCNDEQQELYEFWLKLEDEYSRIEPQWVLHLGDMLHGANRLRYGADTLPTTIDEQVHEFYGIFNRYIEDYRKRKIEMRIVSSSHYHDSLDTQVGVRIADFIDNNTRKVWAGDIGFVKLNDKWIHYRHTQWGGMTYRTTPMDKEMFYASGAEAYGKFPRPHLALFGHKHFYTYMGDQEHLYIQCPCWQLWTPWKSSIAQYMRFQPDIGSIFIVLTDRARILKEHLMMKIPHYAEHIEDLSPKEQGPKQ